MGSRAGSRPRRRGSRSWPSRCSAPPWSRYRPGPRASRSTVSMSSRESTSAASSTSRSCSTAPWAGTSVMASTEGGTEIEEVAANTPEKIIRQTIDPAIGLGGWQAAGDRIRVGAHRRRLRATAPGSSDPRRRPPSQWDTDLIEINPLVVTTGGEVMALDGKMSFDANALFRHPELAELRDPTEEDPAEIEASSHGLVLRQDGRDHRVHGQRRGSRHVHHGHHQIRRG